MTDREKVTEELQSLRDFLMNKAFNENNNSTVNVLMHYRDVVIDTLALLKEQEAVAPVMVPHSRGIAYNCGACGTEIAVIRDTVSADWQKNSVRFCQRCGRAVKW